MKLVKKTYCWVLLLVLLVAFNTEAQDNTLTLKQCIEQTIENNTDFKSIENRQRINELNKKIQRTDLFPDFGIATNLNQFIQNSTVIFTNDILPQSTINGARTNSSNASINSTINISRIGHTIGQLKATDYSNASYSELSTQEKNNVLQLVCETYFLCVYNEQLEKVLTKKIQASEKVLEIAHQKLNLGEIDSIEYYQAYINLQKDINERTSISSLKSSFYNRLSTLLNLPTNAQVKLDTVLPILHIQNLNATNNKKSFEEVALENELLEINHQRKSMTWNMLPNLSLLSGYGYQNQTFQNGIVRQNSALGLSYGISLDYQFGGIKNAIQQKKILALEEQNIQLELMHSSQVTQNEKELLAKESEELTAILKTQKDILRLAKVKLTNEITGYTMGKNSLIEVRIAQDQFLQAQIDLYQSSINLRLSELKQIALFHNLETTLLQLL